MLRDERGSDCAIQADIEDGLLSVFLNVLLKVIRLCSFGTSDSDWVTMSTKSLWRDFASQLRLRRLAEQPDVDIVDGMPRLWRRELLFERLTEFKDDGLHVRLKPSRLPLHLGVEAGC